MDASYGARAIGASTERTPLSIFDLDRTLTRRPTYSRFLLRAAWRTAPWRMLFVPAVLGSMLGYKLGLVGRRALKERMQRLMLGGVLARASAERVIADFVRREFAGGMYEDAFAAIARERAEGRTIVIATAAPAYYAEALGLLLGADAVVATPSSWTDEGLADAIPGDNCHGMAKLEAVRACLSGAGYDLARLHVRAFSDDVSDLPLFGWSDEPVAVNPSRTLRRIAEARDWPILDWRRAERRAPRVEAVSEPAAMRKSVPTT